MWLGFRIIDAAGREIYRLGQVKHGHTEPGTKSFKVVLGDKQGNIVDVNILDADRVPYDTRIEPRGYRDEQYIVDLPADLEGPVQLTADLNYWSFSQALLEHLMGKKAPQTVITRMATVTRMAPVQIQTRQLALTD